MTEPLFQRLTENVGYTHQDDLLRSLAGTAPGVPETPNGIPTRSPTSQKIRHAQDLMNEGGKGEEARKLLKEALTAARLDKNEEEEAEALIALALTSSSRRGVGDREHYFLELEKKSAGLKKPVFRALFYRAKAAFLLDQGDQEGAADALEEAIAVCVSEPEDEKKNNGTQACVTRAEYVHLLCSLKRFEKAAEILIDCEEYARSNTDLGSGELLQLALEAGIHLALEKMDQLGAIERISELEISATSVRLADKIGGNLINVANQCSQRGAHEAALLAAEVAIRLGRRAQNREGPSYLVGAFYTEAAVVFRAGDGALALAKAEAVLDFCNNPNDSAIKWATHQLIAEINRLSGNPEEAVDLARTALSEAVGGMEEIAFAKLGLARALNDNGQTEEALKQVREGWRVMEGDDLPTKAKVEFLSHIVTYASQLGFGDETDAALMALDRIPSKPKEIVDDIASIGRRAEMITKIRSRFIEVHQGDGCLQGDPAKQSQTVQEGNTIILKPLLEWWDGLADAPSELVAGAYEFWGRGNFVRILDNLRRFPKALNITLEVRSLSDIRRAIRMWGMYADVIILLWKGKQESASSGIIVPESFLSEPGGHGYFIFDGAELIPNDSGRSWLGAYGLGTTLPYEVAKFLATEARQFVEAGRLIIVPAVGAACISPGHGVFEQLFAQAANAVPGIRSRSRLISPIGAIPHSSDIPIGVLCDLVDAESERLRRLRRLLMKRAHQSDNSVQDARILALEIEDALSEMADASLRVFNKGGFAGAVEPLATTSAHFRADGRQLTGDGNEVPFAPLFLLQTLGYGWQVDRPDEGGIGRRFEPEAGAAIGTWLAPAEAGWFVPMMENSE
jgi:tetratricopeptide (TPR) repeat protein